MGIYLRTISPAGPPRFLGSTPADRVDCGFHLADSERLWIANLSYLFYLA